MTENFRKYSTDWEPTRGILTCTVMLNKQKQKKKIGGHLKKKNKKPEKTKGHACGIHMRESADGSSFLWSVTQAMMYRPAYVQYVLRAGNDSCKCTPKHTLFPSCPKPLYHSDALYTTIYVKVSLTLHVNEN